MSIQPLNSHTEECVSQVYVWAMSLQNWTYIPYSTYLWKKVLNKCIYNNINFEIALNLKSLWSK